MTDTIAVDDNNSNNATNTAINSTPYPTTAMNNDTTIASGDEFRLNLFGTYIYPFRWLTLQTLYSWLGPLSSLAMIIGCVLPYVPQYVTIHKSQNYKGFSTYVCLTLLISNILRVAFWFGHPFELPLIIQSILQIITQVLLLELCVRVKRRHTDTSTSIEKTFFSFNPRYFWSWTNLISYLEFLILFIALLTIAVYIFIDNKLFIESIGYCALATESFLGLPQVIKNFRKKSVEGMSLSMVLMWLGGDAFKTGYFIANQVPYQFWLCGMLQITIDLLILVQVCIFRPSAPRKVSSNQDDQPKEMMAL